MSGKYPHLTTKVDIEVLNRTERIRHNDTGKVATLESRHDTPRISSSISSISTKSSKVTSSSPEIQLPRDKSAAYDTSQL